MTAMRGKQLLEEIENCSLLPGRLAFWWFGQMGFAVKMEKTVLFIDLYLTEDPAVPRRVPPLLKPMELEAEYLLGTHDHIDHIDREAWREIAARAPHTKFAVPRAHVRSLFHDLGIPSSRLIGINEGESVMLGDIKVTGIAAAHEFLERDGSGNFLNLSYILEGGGLRVFHAGDLCLYEGLIAKLKTFGGFDVMFVPINGRDGRRLASGCLGNMTFQEAADFCGALKPRICVPGHYDMFEGNGEDPERFAEYVRVKYPDQAFWFGEYGRKVTV